MRRVAGAGLLLVVGCNQIFGLTPARTWDAGPDAPPEIPHVELTWQLATVKPDGTPEAPLYPLFAPGDAPQIRLAPRGDSLAPAEYLSSAGQEGWIVIPSSYLGGPWRLEYTLPGGVPHEVQWAPDGKIFRLAVPMVGRLARDPVPAGSGYTITPSDYSGTYVNPRVFTTGLWTDGQVTALFRGPTGSTIDYDFANARSLSGDKGRPDPLQGDRAMVVDFATFTDVMTGARCQVASGSASFDDDKAALAAGMYTLQTPTWDTGTSPVNAPAVDMAFVNRLTADPLHGTVDPSSLLLYGAAASTQLPGLTGAPSPGAGILLPVPVMQILLRCPSTTSSLPPTAIPATLDAFPRVLHVQLVATRQVLGATLHAGLETVIASDAGGFTISFPAPMATKMALTTPQRGTLDLAGPSDQLAAGSPTGDFTLDFTPETGAGLRADYHDVVLHRIANSTLTPVRIFTVTGPSVQIDGALLVPGDYVFEIRTYKGHMRARNGDLVSVDYPYGAAIIFTRTFTIP